MNFHPSNPSKRSKESAVIVLIEETTDALILTQRSAHLRDHPGEICFPGGRWQVGDSNFLATALRELQEELGVEASRIQPIKPLGREKTLHGAIIYPWLATISTLQPYIANAHEVASVLTLPMREVKDITNYKEIVIHRDGNLFKSCQFTASQEFVWGATARIMRQLCEIT